jgi:hypothetical protein
MKTRTSLLALTACAVLVGTLASLMKPDTLRVPPAYADGTLGAPSSEAHVTEATLAPASAWPETPAPSKRALAMTAYVLDAMIEWNKGPMAGAATHMPEIAADYVAVSLEGVTVWPDSDGSKEAILLARIGWFESRFRDYVDDGRCNAWAKLCMVYSAGTPYCDYDRLPSKEASDLMHLGTCDGGRARGCEQVHGDFGADRKEAFRAALLQARHSIQQGVGLRYYVGGDGSERAEMARERLDTALDWVKKHPFVVAP